MNKFMGFIRRERLYLLVLTFVLVVNIAAMIAYGKKDVAGRKAAAGEVKVSEIAAPAAGGQTAEEARRAALERTLAGNRPLATVIGLTSLLVVLVFLLGIAIDVMLASHIIGKNRLEITTYRLQPAAWGVWDVAKVVILFLFFGYIIIMVESVLARIFPAIKDDNFRMILNSSVLDAIAVILIIYFAVVERKEKIASLGLSLKNFGRNIFYGVIGYIALIPILIAVLAATAFFVNMIKYVPPKQPVVELFLKEKDAHFLFYTSVFAAICGPMIEELFFRGFMYGAFKKRLGILPAVIITSATFAALHAHAVGFLPIMVLGVLLAYLYEKTGTLVSSITVHAIHNLSMVLLVFLVKQLGV